ncbi:DNA-binding response regulator, OmpR family, contains REC and winged-helix (wHTH) domain [Lachnospiraceae bacterium NE2001]|nr:DNA-binding response regulator, OmpR family, contains REC and winged-helix (wHTH) domain [Lachnospiraceae bacterium NE2001]
MRKVLIVEDDREIRGLLRDFLQENDFEVDEAKEGNEASSYLANEKYDIILMDMMLPFKSGDVLIQELRDSNDREKSKTPVIVISAKTMKDTRLEVLRMGADDYIIKPFDLDEVLVRIEVVLRRAEGEMSSGAGGSGNELSFEGLVLNKEMNSVSFEGAPVKLTAKEMQLLELFLRNPQKTFTKANLYEAVWEDTYYYEDNTINVHMSNLRSKLKKSTGREFIETVWGIGYKLSQ